MVLHWFKSARSGELSLPENTVSSDCCVKLWMYIVFPNHTIDALRWRKLVELSALIKIPTDQTPQLGQAYFTNLAELEHLYAELDLSLTASHSQILHAWRREIKQVHPDHNPQPEAINRTQNLLELRKNLQF